MAERLNVWRDAGTEPYTSGLFDIVESRFLRGILVTAAMSGKHFAIDILKFLN